MATDSKDKGELTLASLLHPLDLFWTKASYRKVADEFHPFHQHSVNVALHVLTTGLGVWGAVRLAMLTQLGTSAVLAYGILIALTTPIVTALCHTVFLYGCWQTPTVAVTFLDSYTLTPLYVGVAAVVLGYGLQDLAHYLCVEKTYMGSYINAKPWMLLIHSVWLMPLVIDGVLVRNLFLDCIPSRNRNVVVDVASRQAVEDLRTWINATIPSTPETTHVWPHAQPATDGPVTQLEQDAAILAGFRRVFSATHYDIRPVVPMNEIYVTAVGAKRAINSDAVFYTPHTDGPYWWLPGASLYRVLVGVTPNQMVRTHFNLQHESQDQVLDMYNVVGFDYNRELHWIDHVPNAVNSERRSLVKLHFIVYPKGWHRYGALCAKANTTYNTWARGNFLQTLRPSTVYDYAVAWWIWLTTWSNALWEEHVGWSNLMYIATSYAVSAAIPGFGSYPFLILTSFRHYLVYMTTFAFRQPMVAHGFLMRDAKLYKTISMMHLARALVPYVDIPRDVPGLAMACVGFAVTLAATARLGMVRTYFGTELGFVKPRWIEGFPYGTIPHPMIVGQIFAFAVLLVTLWERLAAEHVALLVAHMSCYAAHMLQEMLTSSY
jgi:hypothetical protein